MNTIDKKDIKKFAKELKQAADYLAEHKNEGGCYHFHTVEMEDKEINKNVSIVLGWSDYGNEVKAKQLDKYYDNPYRLAVKVGYQPVNSMMQCDYDVDFNQVYDKETEDVYDTEIFLYKDSNFEKVAESIINEYNYVISSWKSWAHE